MEFHTTLRRTSGTYVPTNLLNYVKYESYSEDLILEQAWYPLSKTLAEKAAWEFCNENGIDLVTVLPTFVIGPSLPSDLCSTACDVLGLLKGNLYYKVKL